MNFHESPRVSAIAIVLISLKMVACASELPRTQIPRSGVWQVTLIGPLDSVGGWFGRGDVIIRYEVHRDGAAYTAGELYRAGRHDYSFAISYPKNEWVQPNVLRFYGELSGSPSTFRIRLLNKGADQIKWLTVFSRERFLIFAVPPNERVEFSSLHWGPQTLFVEGQFDNGQQIARREVLLSDSTREVHIVAENSATNVEAR